MEHYTLVKKTINFIKEVFVWFSILCSISCLIGEITYLIFVGNITAPIVYVRDDFFHVFLNET